MANGLDRSISGAPADPGQAFERAEEDDVDAPTAEETIGDVGSTATAPVDDDDAPTAAETIGDVGSTPTAPVDDDDVDGVDRSASGAPADPGEAVERARESGQQESAPTAEETIQDVGSTAEASGGQSDGLSAEETIQDVGSTATAPRDSSGLGGPSDEFRPRQELGGNQRTTLQPSEEMPVESIEAPTTARRTEARPVRGGDRSGGIAQAVLGPPGVIESEIGYAISDPVGAIVGPPGSVESGAGDVAYGIRDVSAGAADAVTETVVEPAAPYVGEAAESIPLQPTALVPDPDGGGFADVGTTASAEQLAGKEDDAVLDSGGPETAAGEAAESFSRGAGQTAVQSTIGLPAGAVETGGVTADASEFTASEIEEKGLVEGARAAAEAGYDVTQTAVQAGVKYAQERPAQAAGAIVGGALSGVATGRAVEAAGRAARLRYGTEGDAIDFGETTSPSGTEGQLPEFETSPDAPTEEAVQEVRERATDQPDVLQDELGESITYRSETERLPSDFEAQLGQYELPGVFTSPDASPLRLDIGSETSASSLRPRLPNPFAAPQRLSAFESPDVEGMPDSATGARRVEAPDGGTMPDMETSGAEFLVDEADAGTAYVRPTGSRTTELEAIFPPGSEFVRAGTRRVNVPDGTDATLDVYQRVDTGGTDVDVPEQDVIPGEEVLRRESLGGTDPGTPVTPPSPALPSTGQAGSTSPNQTSVEVEPSRTVTQDTTTDRSTTSNDGGATTDTEGVTLPTEPTSPPTDSRPTTPSSGPTGGPTGAESPPTTPPTEPPRVPSRPPSRPPSQPPSAPPRGPPSIPGGPPSRPPAISTPTPPDTPVRPRPSLPDRDSDEDEEFSLLIPARQDVLTDFVDPLTGERLRTARGTNGGQFF